MGPWRQWLVVLFLAGCLLAAAMLVGGQPAPAEPKVSIAAGQEQVSGAREAHLSLRIVNPDDGDALTTRESLQQITVTAPEAATFSLDPGAHTLRYQDRTYPREPGDVQQDLWTLEATVHRLWINHTGVGARTNTAEGTGSTGDAETGSGIAEGEQALLNMTLARLAPTAQPQEDRWEMVLTGDSTNTTRIITTHRFPLSIQALAITGPPGATDGTVSNATTLTLRAQVRNNGTATTDFAPNATLQGGTLVAIDPAARELRPGQTAFLFLTVRAQDLEGGAITIHVEDLQGTRLSSPASHVWLAQEPAAIPPSKATVTAFPSVLPQREAPRPATLTFNLSNIGEATALLHEPRLSLLTPLDNQDVTDQFDVTLEDTPRHIEGNTARSVVYNVSTTPRTEHGGAVLTLLTLGYEDTNVRNGTLAGELSLLSPEPAFEVDTGPPLLEDLRVQPNPVRVTGSQVPPVTIEVTTSDDVQAQPALRGELRDPTGTDVLAQFTPEGTWDGSTFTSTLDLAGLLERPAPQVPGVYLLAITASDGTGSGTTDTSTVSVQDESPPSLVENSLSIAPSRAFAYQGTGTILNVTVDATDNLQVNRVQATLVRHLATTPATTETRVTLEPWQVDDAGIGTWTVEAPIRPGTYDLALEAHDGTHTTELLRSRYLVVEDVNPPIVGSPLGNGELQASVNATTPLTVEVAVSDDDALATVQASIVRPLAPGIPVTTAAMRPGPGDRWSAILEAPLPLEEGRYVVLINTQDLWGNRVNHTLETGLPLTVDNRPPSSPTPTEPADGAALGQDRVRFAWGASDDEVSEVTYRFTAQGPPGTFTRSTENRFLELDLHEGSWTWRVEAVDAAGNRAPGPNQALVVDRTPPQLVTVPALPGPVGTQTGLRVVAEDISLTQLLYAVDDGPLRPAEGSAVVVELDGLSPGPHTLTIRAHDRTGRQNETVLPFDLDPTSPEATLLTPTALPAGDPIHFDGNDTGSGLAHIWVQVGDEEPRSLKPGEPLHLEPGVHTLTYRAEDRAGNQGRLHAVTVRVDPTPPEVDRLLIEDGTISVRVDDEALANVTATITGNGAEHVVHLRDDGRASDQRAGDGVYTGGLPSLERGTYTVTVQATDTAGQLTTLSVDHSQEGIPLAVLVAGGILVTVLGGAGVLYARGRWD